MTSDTSFPFGRTAAGAFDDEPNRREVAFEGHAERSSHDRVDALRGDGVQSSLSQLLAWAHAGV